jgi:hypothetical protein
MTGDIQLRDRTFLLYAAKHYDNPNCNSHEEFLDDLRRFKYVKRLINRYIETGDLKWRLILNHIIVIYNVFGSEAATRMLFLRLQGLEQYLKPFLVRIGQMPERLSVGDRTVIDSDVPMDLTIVDALRTL